jgi:hypothetical protein
MKSWRRRKASEPTNHPLSWLTAARLIATAERLGKGITENSHLLIYQEKRNYWRARVYELIFPSAPNAIYGIVRFPSRTDRRWYKAREY